MWKALDNFLYKIEITLFPQLKQLTLPGLREGFSQLNGEPPPPTPYAIPPQQSIPVDLERIYEELQYLRWFYANVDVDAGVRNSMRIAYQAKFLKPVPYGILRDERMHPIE